MRIVERSELVEHFEGYARAKRYSFVVASSTDEPEQVFLEALHQLSGAGDGVAARVGFCGFVVATAYSSSEIERLLRNACPGNWCHVVAAVTPTRGVSEAVRETEWRASKYASQTKGTRFEVLP